MEIYVAVHMCTIFPDGQRQFYHCLKIPERFKMDLGKEWKFAMAKEWKQASAVICVLLFHALIIFTSLFLYFVAAAK